MIKVLVRYNDGTLDIAPVGEPGADSLIRASRLARLYAESFGVIRASVVSHPGGGNPEIVSIFQAGVLVTPEVIEENQ